MPVTALPKPRGPLSVALQSSLRDLPVNPVPRQDLESSLRQRWPGMLALEAATVAP